MSACIEVKGFGFTEQCSLSGWARDYIQEDEIAARIAKYMLKYESDAYPYNEDDPKFYMEFAILDKDDFVRQLNILWPGGYGAESS